ncbi:MAG: hypothetical protein AMXMBFR12_00770 [Candidatus Babeliales bacterium]
MIFYRILLYFMVSIVASFLNADNIGIQFRVGHFRPNSHLFRNIYQNGGIEYEGELNYEYMPGNTIWFNANSFERRGLTENNEETKIQLHPVSAGIKQLIPFASCLNLYLGAGSCCTFMQVKGKSLFLDERDHKHSWGFVGKSGILVLLSQSIFVDIFADYYYTEITFDEQKRNLGGLRAGVGIGLLF